MESSGTAPSQKDLATGIGLPRQAPELNSTDLGHSLGLRAKLLVDE